MRITRLQNPLLDAAKRPKVTGLGSESGSAASAPPTRSSSKSGAWWEDEPHWTNPAPPYIKTIESSSEREHAKNA